MAEHLHTRIAQATRDLLDDGSTDWNSGEVFPFRVYPVDGARLPYTSAWCGDEEVTNQAGDDEEDKTVEADLEVMVAGFFHAPVAQLDALIGAHMKQVQSILAAGIELDGVKVSFDYRGCSKSYEGADLEYTEVLQRFVVQICYLASAPDTLSWQ